MLLELNMCLTTFIRIINNNQRIINIFILKLRQLNHFLILVPFSKTTNSIKGVLMNNSFVTLHDLIFVLW